MGKARSGAAVTLASHGGAIHTLFSLFLFFALPACSACHLENCANFLPGEAAGWTLRPSPTLGRGKDRTNLSNNTSELSELLTRVLLPRYEVETASPVSYRGLQENKVA